MKSCPFCGTKIKDENKPCPSCGYGYGMNNSEILGEAREIESRTIFDEQQSPQNVSDNDKDVKTGWKAMLIIVTIFILPLVGIIFGCVFTLKPYPKYKKFGKMLLIIAFVTIALTAIIRSVMGFYSFF